MLKNSQETYSEFIQIAWKKLNQDITPSKHKEFLEKSQLKTLYKAYAKHSSRVSIPKNPRRGSKLYESMIEFLDATEQRIVQPQNAGRQGLPPTINQTALRAEYQRLIRRKNHKPKAQARHTLRTYLHVYPTGTTLKKNKPILPESRETSNWRIGINVHPQDIPKAATALMGIIGQT